MVRKIAVIGNDFNSVHPVFTRIPEALEETAAHINETIEFHSFSTQSLCGSADWLKSYAGIFVAPSPFQNLEGLYACAGFARENNMLKHVCTP
ncbi:MAG: hypothetical protein KKD21_00570 [Proteobacteria bacterium]|nr:hypothetical protein [Pseudomonadota bacterium]MBU1695523.1 hypothetical protein [Pseudomonadota bacterium]